MSQIDRKNYVICKECKELVHKEVVVRYDTSTEEKKSHANLHPDCVEVFKQKREDWVKWDELYQYVKKDVLKYEDKQKLSNHLVRRLQGMRCGEYGTRRNKRVILSEEGYPYEVILMTFKFKKIDILNAIYDNSKFKNERHKEDYMMAIISNSINDVYLKMKEKEESNKRTEALDFNEMVYESEFKNKSNIKKNKVANKLKHLF